MPYIISCMTCVYNCFHTEIGSSTLYLQHSAVQTGSKCSNFEPNFKVNEYSVLAMSHRVVVSHR